MRHLHVVLLLVLTACASQGERVEQWRDLWNPAKATGEFEPVRSIADLGQDTAQCDYEMAQAQAVAPQYTLQPQPATSAQGAQLNAAVANLGGAMVSGVPRSLFYKCMRARGWEFVGYE